jgi:hypothetical protein
MVSSNDFNFSKLALYVSTLQCLTLIHNYFYILAKKFNYLLKNHERILLNNNTCRLGAKLGGGCFGTVYYFSNYILDFRLFNLS